MLKQRILLAQNGVISGTNLVGGIQNGNITLSQSYLNFTELEFVINATNNNFSFGTNEQNAIRIPTSTLREGSPRGVVFRINTSTSGTTRVVQISAPNMTTITIAGADGTRLFWIYGLR